MTYVLIGQWAGRIKAFGPFDDADDARELANTIGVDMEWSVVPLIPAG